MRFDLERAAHHLSCGGPLAERHPGDAAGALRELCDILDGDAVAALRGVDLRIDLTPEEQRIIGEGDVAEMYRRGVHPNVVRNFAGTFGIDYRAKYREGGLTA